MKIAVLIKHTVDVRRVKINPDTGIPDYEGKAGLDRPDLHAINAAIDLAESGESSITMVGLGPVEMKDDLVSAIATAVGNAEATHIVLADEADTLFAARSLADVLRTEGYDVIITAKLSEDHGTGQIGMQVAEFLDIPHLSGVLSADQSGDILSVTYELDGFPDTIEVPTPILLVLSGREGEPKRHPSLRGMMSARKKTIAEHVVADVAKSDLSWTDPMAARRGGERTVVRDEDPAEAAKKLADWLKEHRLIG